MSFHCIVVAKNPTKILYKNTKMQLCTTEMISTAVISKMTVVKVNEKLTKNKKGD